MSRELPSGTLTFLFTDVEGSTRLLDELGAEGFAQALGEHRQVLRDAFARHDGTEVDRQGDSFFVAFPTARGALAAACDAQAALEGGRIRVRMGMHTGVALVSGGDYVGMDVHRAARIAAAAHGGQVVCSRETAAAVGADGLRDLGEHRFKDLAAPERVFQVGDRDFAPLKSLYHANLPVVATPFLGRKAELEDVDELLRRKDVRLLALTGPGGTGKTRLALQAAAEAADSFPDGVHWVALAPLREAELVPATVAQALGVPEEAGRALDDVLAGRLGGRRTLLVLDNAEHLLPAVAPSIARLVAVEGPTVLVTTRERLQLQGENVYDVGPLDDPDARRLFLMRAAALDVSVERTDVIERLCHRLDNIPLALELAAARLRVFTPEQLLDRLAARLDLLKGTRDADPRQQTLRATIDWSYNLLSPGEQRLFCRLSVFAGGATYEAAEAVSDADPDTLQSLIDKSLVRRRATETGLRFWMLETIRGYAVEELERSGARESLCERYADWVIGEVTRGVETHWGRTPEEWYTRVAAELDNIRDALDWLGARNDGERFARICIAMRGYWHLRGSSSEGAVHLERALTLAVPDRIRTGLLIGVSWLARDRMDVARLRAAAEEVVEIAQRDGNHDAMVAGLRDLGVGDALAGDTELALSRWREALALAREHDLHGYLPGLTGNLAAAELQRRNWSAARTLSAEAAEFADQNGDAQVSAISRLNEGTATILDGEPAAARRPLLEALELSVARGWTFVAHEVLDALAAVVTAEGDAARAARLMGAAQALREDGGLASEELEEEQRRITRSRLQEKLGEAMFDDAFAAGRKLPLAEAAADARTR